MRSGGGIPSLPILWDVHTSHTAMPVKFGSSMLTTTEQSGTSSRSTPQVPPRISPLTSVETHTSVTMMTISTNLRYAYRDSQGWHTQVVDKDPEDAGAYTSLALDSRGYPHIAYQGHRIVAPLNLKYAYFDGSVWHTEVVDNDGNLGYVISLDLDSNDHPHILYYDYERRMLKYAHHDGASWQTSFVAQSVSGFLKLDRHGRPAVSLISDSDLKYGYFDGTQWHFEVVDADVDSGAYAPRTSLDFDSEGYPHIAYQDNTTLVIKYAYSDGASWHLENVAPGCAVIPDSDCSLSLSVDTRDQPHISFNNAVERKLRYAVRHRLYDFTGFFPPIENLPEVNSVKAGQAIPVKFSLNGYQGMDIVALGYPASIPVECGTTADSAIALTSSPGNSSLSYDAVTDQYQYVWKTNKSWAGSCRTLVLKLSDGTSHRANFQFR